MAHECYVVLDMLMLLYRQVYLLKGITEFEEYAIVCLMQFIDYLLVCLFMCMCIYIYLYLNKLVLWKTGIMAAENSMLPSME